MAARFLVQEEFLAAVTGNPESVDSAEEVVSTRLGTGWPHIPGPLKREGLPQAALGCYVSSLEAWVGVCAVPSR